MTSSTSSTIWYCTNTTTNTTSDTAPIATSVTVAVAVIDNVSVRIVFAAVHQIVAMTRSMSQRLAGVYESAIAVQTTTVTSSRVQLLSTAPRVIDVFHCNIDSCLNHAETQWAKTSLLPTPKTECFLQQRHYKRSGPAPPSPFARFVTPNRQHMLTLVGVLRRASLLEVRNTAAEVTSAKMWHRKWQRLRSEAQKHKLELATDIKKLPIACQSCKETYNCCLNGPTDGKDSPSIRFLTCIQGWPRAVTVTSDIW